MKRLRHIALRLKVNRRVQVGDAKIGGLTEEQAGRLGRRMQDRQVCGSGSIQKIQRVSQNKEETDLVGAYKAGVQVLWAGGRSYDYWKHEENQCKE